jgi:hypothetical protein
VAFYRDIALGIIDNPDGVAALERFFFEAFG